MNVLRYILITLFGFCFSAFIIYSFIVTKERNKIRKSDKIQQQKVAAVNQNLMVSIDTYDRLISMIKLAYSKLEVVKEIRELEKQNAEIRSLVLTDKDDRYVSFNNLIYRKKYYFVDFKLCVIECSEFFEAIKTALPSTSRSALFDLIDILESYVKYYEASDSDISNKTLDI